MSKLNTIPEWQKLKRKKRRGNESQKIIRIALGSQVRISKVRFEVIVKTSITSMNYEKHTKQQEAIIPQKKQNKNW